MARESNWVPALEAAQLLAKRFGGATRAQRALALALREQLLTVGAEEISYCEYDDDENIREQTDKAPKGKRFLEIDPELWLRSERWEADVADWDWVEGSFEVEDLTSGQTWDLMGVHFKRNELEALDPAQAPFSAAALADLPFSRPESPDAPSAKAPRGPKAKLDRWAHAMVALVELERQGKLNSSAIDGPSTLTRAVLELAGDNAHGERTLGPVMSHVFAQTVTQTPMHVKVVALIEAVLKLAQNNELSSTYCPNAEHLAKRVAAYVPAGLDVDDAMAKQVAAVAFKRLCR